MTNVPLAIALHALHVPHGDDLFNDVARLTTEASGVEVN